MQFDDQFIIITDLYPSPVIIDRLPQEESDGSTSNRKRRLGLPLHGSPLADIFPIMVEPAPGDTISNHDLADLMEKRLEDPVLILKRFPKLQLSPRNNEDEGVESD